MKTKILFLFIFAAVVLLSFTVATKSSKNENKVGTNKTKIETSGGLAIEDTNQWN